MKILSNFDTHFEEKVVANYKEKYGDKMMVIHREKIFFLFYVLGPIVVLSIFSVIMITLMVWDRSEFTGDELTNQVKNVFFGALLLRVLFFYGFKILKRFIDYKMDFAIVTPFEIINYNQTGIFQRNGHSIDADKIKTITIDKNGFINSFFNFGSLIFLSEGDAQGRGDIRLSYVKDPDTVRSKIKDIIYSIEHKDEAGTLEEIKKEKK